MHWDVHCFPGCCFDTRQILLLKNGTNTVVNNKSKAHCKVISGVWHSFYSGQEITDPKQIEIDHVLPFDWFYDNVVDKSPENMLKIYNDEDNLVIATAHENEEKSNKLNVPFDVSEYVHLEYKSKQCDFCHKYSMNNCNQVCNY